MANFIIIGAGRTFADLIAGQTNRLAMSLGARRRTPAPTHVIGEGGVSQQYLGQCAHTMKQYAIIFPYAPEEIKHASHNLRKNTHAP